MNPFLTVLIVVPLIASTLLGIGLMLVAIEKESVLGVAVAVVIFGPISAYLVLVLKRTSSREGSLLAFPGSETVGESVRKRQANFILFFTFVALGIGSALTFDYESIKGLPGILAFIMGLVLLWSGFMLTRLQLPVDESAFAQLVITRSFYPKRTIGTVMGAAAIGVVVVLRYKYFNDWKDVSTWDIAGLFFFLASACVWVALYDWKVQKRIDLFRRE